MDSELNRQVMACPMNGLNCSDGVRSDFKNHPVTEQKIKCRLWTHLLGKDPQSEKSIDRFDCSLSWVPVLLVENAQMTRQATSSTDKVANEVRKHHAAFVGALQHDAQKRLLDADPKLNEKEIDRIQGDVYGVRQ